MDNKKQNKYDPAIDILRIISILAVVMIHTTTRTLEASRFDLLKFTWTLFLNQAFRFAVPVFFMLSGFVLELNYVNHTNYLTYFKKRISRLFIPYVFWSAIYYFFVYTRHTENFFQSVINGDASYQLYFIPSLLIFYILFPLMHKFYSTISNKFIIVILGIIQMILLYVDYSPKPLLIFFPVKIAILNFYIFLLGIISALHIDKIVQLINKWRYAFSIITLAIGFLIFYEGLNGYLKTHNYLYFYSQWRVSVFIYSILVSGLLYTFFQKKLLNSVFVKKLSSLTFFIFFIHVIVLEIVWRMIGINLFNISKNNLVRKLLFDPVFFFIVVGISYCIAFIAHKIPKLSKLTG